MCVFRNKGSTCLFVINPCDNSNRRASFRTVFASFCFLHKNTHLKGDQFGDIKPRKAYENPTDLAFEHINHWLQGFPYPTGYDGAPQCHSLCLQHLGGAGAGRGVKKTSLRTNMNRVYMVQETWRFSDFRFLQDG